MIKALLGLGFTNTKSPCNVYYFWILTYAKILTSYIVTLKLRSERKTNVA